MSARRYQEDSRRSARTSQLATVVDGRDPGRNTGRDACSRRRRAVRQPDAVLGDRKPDDPPRRITYRVLTDHRALEQFRESLHLC